MVPLLEAEDVGGRSEVQLKAQKMGSKGFVGTGPVGLGADADAPGGDVHELRRAAALGGDGDHGLGVFGRRDAPHQRPVERVPWSSGSAGG